MTRNRVFFALWPAAILPILACEAPNQRITPASESNSGATAQDTAKSADDPMHPRVRVETTVGAFVIELDGEQAPVTVLNFVQLVHDKHYKGTIFHRVIKGSIIQGGGYTPDMESKPLVREHPFDDRWHNNLKNTKGSVALIRGTGPHGSGSAEFYINMTDNKRLDDSKLGGLYSVFGRIVGGFDTVERLHNLPLGPHEKYAGGQSAVVPVTPVVIRSVELLSPFNPMRVQHAAYQARALQDEKAAALVKELESQTGNKAVKTESGVMYVDVVVGKGFSPQLFDTIEINYEGRLLSGNVYETTFDTKPVLRELSKLIAGLQEGLLTMREGGRRTIVIPPHLGFGEGGVPGMIPPDSWLIFDIEYLALR